MKKDYWVYLAFGVLAVLLFITFGYESGSTWAPCRYWGAMMGGGYGMHRHMGGFGFWGFGLLFWVLVILFVYLLVSGRDSFKSGGDAIDILNKRFAKGEITKEEYTKIKNELLEKTEGD